MATFYFHIRDGRTLIKDKQGAEFANLEAARQEAFGAARSMMADMREVGDSVNEQAFEICDAAGEVLAVVNFRDTLAIKAS